MTGPDIGEHRVTRCLALLFCLTFATPAGSEPTPQQISAIRSACVSDFMANCSGVEPGGADALACLQRNVANLSANCQAAVNAAGAPAVPAAPAAPPGVAATPQPAPSPPAPAVASPALPRPPSSQQQAAIRNACRSDFIANCTSVQPGGPEALACLQVNAARLSSACRRAVAAVGGAAARPPAGVAAPPAATIAPPPMPELPLLALLAIHRRCRLDILTRCPLPPGRARIKCLVANTSALTPRCQGALAQARAMAR